MIYLMHLRKTGRLNDHVVTDRKIICKYYEHLMACKMGVM
jgi:hypothetical protein